MPLFYTAHFSFMNCVPTLPYNLVLLNTKIKCNSRSYMKDRNLKSMTLRIFGKREIKSVLKISLTSKILYIISCLINLELVHFCKSNLELLCLYCYLISQEKTTDWVKVFKWFSFMCQLVWWKFSSLGHYAKNFCLFLHTFTSFIFYFLLQIFLILQLQFVSTVVWSSFMV